MNSKGEINDSIAEGSDERRHFERCALISRSKADFFIDLHGTYSTSNYWVNPHNPKNPYDFSILPRLPIINCLGREANGFAVEVRGAMVKMPKRYSAVISNVKTKSLSLKPDYYKRVMSLSKTKKLGIDFDLIAQKAAEVFDKVARGGGVGGQRKISSFMFHAPKLSNKEKFGFRVRKQPRHSFRH
ncbi:MAG: hypothetical protein NTY48_03190 [Candidatus Diapherotrites archaeon]|nr:hypothetical protein [Candidatus Diapherotrites archaeon]